MSNSEAAVSGDAARLNELAELAKFIIKYGSADKLLKEHKPDRKGRCGACRSLGCTLFEAARVAKRHIAAKKLGGSRA